MIKLSSLAAVFLCVGAMAEAPRLPVDEVIEGHLAKARHLTLLKELFTKTNCEVHVSNNHVGIAAGALRSEGIVMAITETSPGNYFAFHQAPKPQFLKNVVESVVHKPVKNPQIVSSSLVASQGASDYTHLKVTVAEPVEVKGAENLYMYESVTVGMSLSAMAKGEVQSKEVKTKSGAIVSAICKPRS